MFRLVAEVLLAVFEAVASGEPVALPAVCSATGVPSSTAHRTLGRLAAAGWVRSTGGTRPRWLVAERVRALVSRPTADLVAAARGVVAALAGVAGETAALWLADGDGVVVGASAAPATPLRVVAPEGWRLPLHACAPGKAVLAAWSDGEVRTFAGGPRGGLAMVTVRTTTDAETLLVDLRRIRREGVAIAFEEEAEGVASVAVGLGRVAALGLVGPSDRLSRRIDELAALVADAAAALPPA